MYKTKKLKAYMKMEERYEMLSLVFGDNLALKDEILKIVDDIGDKHELIPFVYDRVSCVSPNKQSICLEFKDDTRRLGGEYFNEILKKLNINKCEVDV